MRSHARIALVALLVMVAFSGAAQPALATDGARTVHFQGERVAVPAGWPVIRLAERPRTCVRLDRKAVYLGAPSSAQRCPAHAMGRRRAILVDSGADKRAARQRARASRGPLARVSGISGFVGLGFDACAAPSRRTMRAWDSSPYRAIGVYIGGLNRGCSQPNLTASWVSQQIAAGWSLIPTYVGLQAPTSSCTSCATLSAGSATLEGSAAASDAVEQAAAIGIGPGSPIYYDMESYSRTSSATNATLTFLASWTTRLHALGYVSGVYSSSGSGIADLVSRLGTGYVQPDHLWMANWDGRKTVDDPYVPDDAWSDQQRIRQYRGGHDETWGGVTINIDNNYVEGATAGASSPAASDDPKGRLELADSPFPGQLRVSGWAFDPNAPGTPVSIRVYVGGKPGKPGALLHELGPVASGSRSDIALTHRTSGGVGGFDTSFLTVKTGRERLCAYAVDIGPGSDKPLGCRVVGVPPPLSLVKAEAARGAVRVTVRCEWPVETQCPGQILLRARVRVAGASGIGRRPRTKVVRAGVGRRPFRLIGGATQTFYAPLSRRGRLLARGRDKLRTELVLAVPDGRIVRPLVLRPASR